MHRKGHIGVKTCKCTTIYVIQKLFYSVFDSHLRYNCQLYCVYILLSQQVRSKSKKVTIFDNFDHFNGIKKCLDSVYNLDM